MSAVLDSVSTMDSQAQEAMKTVVKQGEKEGTCNV